MAWRKCGYLSNGEQAEITAALSGPRFFSQVQSRTSALGPCYQRDGVCKRRSAGLGRHLVLAEFHYFTKTCTCDHQLSLSPCALEGRDLPKSRAEGGHLES